MPLRFVGDNIVTMEVDAIVNAANNALRMGGGVCGAIFSAAGSDDLQKECNSIGRCDTGKAVITKGYALKARYIIHTVGPVWYGGQKGERELLRSCYQSSLELAVSRDCKSVSFPLISAGIFGYPRELAIKEARESTAAFLAQHDELEVFLVLFGSFSELAPKHMRPVAVSIPEEKKIWPSFDQILAGLIKNKGISVEQAASRSNLTAAAVRELLSGQAPKADTILALSVGLELKPSEALFLLHSTDNEIETDLRWTIIANFLERGPADIHQVNLGLFVMGLPGL
jgi:O-acetyl-ADP-ribose deacetylase (regulator of RNase III)/transcriptional regulator with XRE-family HTH domain